MKSIKACIFDLDGVIVDTAKYHFKAWRRLANELGFDFSHSDNEKLKGVSRVESLKMILAWGGVEKTAEEQLALATRKNDWYTESIKTMPKEEILSGVVPFLKSLQTKGIKIGLGSASKNAKTILTQVDLLHFFEVIVDGNGVKNSKPHPEVFLNGAKELGVLPEECIVFEDAAKGVEAALAGGFRAVGIGDSEVLKKAHLVIDDLEGWTLEKIELETSKKMIGHK